jgi:hypothetical protein
MCKWVSGRCVEWSDAISKVYKLHAYGWINYTPGRRFTDMPVGVVNPKVHSMYEDIAKQEQARRKRAREAIARNAERIRFERREED